MKNLKTLVIGGVSYNVGWSENDFTNAYKTMVDNMSTDIATAKAEAIAAGVVTVEETAGTGDILKTYTIKQNGVEINKINLAKDLVVSSGEIVEVDDVKYLRLTIANQTTPVDIAVTDLVDVYTGQGYIIVTDSNEIVLDATSLDEYLTSAESTTGAKIQSIGLEAKTNSLAVEDLQTTTNDLRTDLGQSDAAAGTDSAFARIKSLEAEIETLSGGVGSVASQIDEKIAAYDEATVQPIDDKVDNHIADVTVHITADERTAWNAAKSTADANKTKLDGISEGANNVSTSYEESTSTLTITIE